MSNAASAVLVAGWSLTGLTAALFLAWYGVPHLLVERPGDPPPGGLSIFLSPRTIELYRIAGLEARLRPAAIPQPQQAEPGGNAASPCRGIPCVQYVVAELLRTRAQRLGSELQPGTRLVAYEPGADGIRAILECPFTGPEVSLQAHYLVIAADSQDRQSQLGVPTDHLEPAKTASGDTQGLAAQYRAGRAFFAGGAARTLKMPAVFALNLDLHEAHNLAWKLAYVVKGLAEPALLETYEAERKPLAELAFQHFESHGDDGQARHAWPVSPVDGLWSSPYRSSAVIAEAVDEPGEPPMAIGSPGTRVPHVVLQRDGRDLSTLDLCGGDFVLLVGPDALAWCEAAERAAAGLEIDLEAHCIGAGKELSTRDARWPAAYGLTEGGALLIRPDGYVGWRARTALPQPELVLTGVLARLLSREPAAH